MLKSFTNQLYAPVEIYSHEKADLRRQLMEKFIGYAREYGCNEIVLGAFADGEEWNPEKAEIRLEIKKNKYLARPTVCEDIYMHYENKKKKVDWEVGLFYMHHAYYHGDNAMNLVEQWLFGVEIVNAIDRSTQGIESVIDLAYKMVREVYPSCEVKRKQAFKEPNGSFTIYPGDNLTYTMCQGGLREKGIGFCLDFDSLMRGYWAKNNILW